MRFISLLALLIAAPAFAQTQPATLQQQLDSGTAEVTTVIANMRMTIIGQANQLSRTETQVNALTKQVADLTKERDELKAKAPPAP